MAVVVVGRTVAGGGDTAAAAADIADIVVAAAVDDDNTAAVGKRPLLLRPCRDCVGMVVGKTVASLTFRRVGLDLPWDGRRAGLG